MANAIENTSRPQPLANDSGVRNWPAAERGPNVSMPMRQPQRTMTAGVRQVSTTEAGSRASGSLTLITILPGRRQHRASIGTAQPVHWGASVTRMAAARPQGAAPEGAGIRRGEVLYMI